MDIRKELLKPYYTREDNKRYRKIIRDNNIYSYRATINTGSKYLNEIVAYLDENSINGKELIDEN